MKESRRWWLTAGSLILAAFLVLGWFGREIYRKVPPIPAEVRTQAGELLMTRDDILRGQQVWQSIGGQQVGSIWGHGAYQAPDWSADWLHREALALQDELAGETHGRPFEVLSGPERAARHRNLARD